MVVLSETEARPNAGAGIADSPADRSARPAGVAATRVARAGMLLGALGLASSLFVIVRLFETWRVGPHAAAHRISLLGQHLTYPAANADAVIILLLASLGFAVTAMAVTGAARELAAARRFRQVIAASSPAARGDALVIADERPRAFCAGLLRPRVYVSSGAVALLDAQALEAVLVHERHHARRRDPLRLAAGRVVVRALFFVPWLGRLHRHERALAELGADESALSAGPGNRSALARAMLSFEDAAGAGGSVGIDPARVDHLLGEPPSWRFPVLLCLFSLLVVGLLLAIAVLAGQLATGAATLAPPFLSSQPCVVALALIPGALGLVVVRLGRL